MSEKQFLKGLELFDNIKIVEKSVRHISELLVNIKTQPIHKVVIVCAGGNAYELNNLDVEFTNQLVKSLVDYKVSQLSELKSEFENL